MPLTICQSLLLAGAVHAAGCGRGMPITLYSGSMTSIMFCEQPEKNEETNRAAARTAALAHPFDAASMEAILCLSRSVTFLQMAPVEHGRVILRHLERCCKRPSCSYRPSSAHCSWSARLWSFRKLCHSRVGQSDDPQQPSHF